MCHYTQIMECWGLRPWLHIEQASILSTEPHFQWFILMLCHFDYYGFVVYFEKNSGFLGWFSLLKISLIFQGLSNSPWKLGLFFSFCSKWYWTFTRLSFNLRTSLAIIDILTILMLPIYEYRISFHLLLWFSISFINVV